MSVTSITLTALNEVSNKELQPMDTKYSPCCPPTDEKKEGRGGERRGGKGREKQMGGQASKVGERKKAARDEEVGLQQLVPVDR